MKPEKIKNRKKRGTETGFYYLQSRYYDPEVGRFISPDSVDYLGASGTTQSWNLFAYCENEPVQNDDPGGNIVISRAYFIGFSLLFGSTISIAKINDFKGNCYLVISVSFTISLPVAWGLGIQYGVFWRYKTVKEYLEKSFRITSLGVVIGIDIHRNVVDFVAKKIEGLGLSFVTGLCFTTASYSILTVELTREFNDVLFKGGLVKWGWK